MLKVKIEKSWFYSAGKKWSWERDGHDVRGVGINREALFSEPEILVEVDRVSYRLVCQEAVDFIRKYGSFYKMKGGTMIGIVSKSLLKEQETL